MLLWGTVKVRPHGLWFSHTLLLGFQHLHTLLPEAVEEEGVEDIVS